MINALVRFAVMRRYLMLSLIILLVGAGFYSYQRLPIDAVPDITNVQVQINTAADGYSPLEVEQRITFVVETALFGLPQLQYSRSLSRYGLSQVTVVFDEGSDIYFVRNLISQRLASITATLPQGVEPQLGPVATGLGEIVTYSLSLKSGATDAVGQPLDSMFLREVQDWIVKPQLAQLDGVAEINTIGGHDKQFHVLPAPEKMLAFGINMVQLAEALRSHNANRGAGFIEHNGQQLLVRSEGQLGSISDIEQVVVALQGNVPVRVADVAEVALGKALRSGAAGLNGEETVLGTVMMLQGGNSRTVAANAAAKLQQIAATLPQGVVLQTLYDRTTLVDKTIATVQKNLLEGALLVLLVLFLLLGNVRAALITAAVIPLAMLATLSGMVSKGVSANLMSLGALDFGLIVDGTVIIVENCMRRLGLAQQQQGAVLALRQRLAVVHSATMEVIKPSLFGVAIITVVYLPLFALTGVEGKMFHPMAATVVMALLAAMLISVTLVPAAVAVFMSGSIKLHESPIICAAKVVYRPLLQRVLQLRVLVLSVAGALVACCLWLATTLGSEFVPQLDEGDIALHAMRVTGTSLTQSVQMQQQLERQLLQFAEVAHVFSKTGTAEIATDAMPPNVSDNIVMLKPRHSWPDPDKTKAELVAQMQTALQQLPGNNYEFTQPIQMRFNELISGVRADVAVKVFGDDLDTLLQLANSIAQQASVVAGSADVTVEQVSGLPVLTVNPKLTELARYGVSIAEFQQLLSMAIGGEEVGLIYQGDRRFPLVLRLPETVRTDIANLAYLPVPTPDGGYVPLQEVATIALQQMPAQISRENGKRRVVVSVNVRQRDLGSFVAELTQRIDAGVSIPAGYWLDYGGSFEQLSSASQRLALVVPVTLLLIIILLLLAFNSLKDALIIFSGVPLALTGGVLALWLRDMPLSVSAAVGFIALSGVAVLNGLVLLAFIRQLWHEKGDLLYAVTEGAITRLRPVLMTALVASLGFVPMALNTGTGAEVQRPLATVVIGGIISATLLTLLVLPVLYQWLHSNDKAQPADAA
ncbi:efflux RND transporter permease subunit [Rheinheimera gaetbuli]